LSYIFYIFGVVEAGQSIYLVHRYIKHLGQGRVTPCKFWDSMYL